MYGFIRKWANLVEEKDEDISSRRNDVLCFFDGRWRDPDGTPIEVSEDEEKLVLDVISRIESANYAATPSLTMMDDVETMEDVADYLECDLEDVFLFFRRPTIELREYKSPSSEDPELAGGLYFLASANESEYPKGVTWVEIADISGNFESTTIFGRMMDLFFSWMRSRNAKLAASNCRETTSDRFFKSRLFLKRFENYGFVKLEDVDRTETIDGERFHLNVLVDERWWERLSPEEREETVDLVEAYL